MPDPRAPSSKIELRVLAGHQTAVIRDEVPESGLAEAMGRMFQTVMSVLSEQGIEPASQPFARYHTFGDTIDFEAGVIVKTPVQPAGEVKPGELPGGPAAIAVHTGTYETLGATHAAMRRWLEANPAQQPNGGPFEIYVSDPASEPDPARWMTEVVYPLKPNAEIG
ncbi:MAG: GyrI-like domain-containing protein [Candidatus Limnocylindrales bacterium]